MSDTLLIGAQMTVTFSCEKRRPPAIVDFPLLRLSGGHQPMANDDESYGIVYNGELYNFLEPLPGDARGQRVFLQDQVRHRGHPPIL